MKAEMIFAAIVLAAAPGCAAAKKTGQVAGGATAWLAGAMIDGILDGDDETPIEEYERERRERKWKQHWREHPDVNPAMTAAFKDDYE